jgi:DNA polymerase
VAKKPEEFLERVEEKIRFFSDLGVDFLFSSELVSSTRGSKKAAAFRRLEEEVLACRRCPLAITRTHAVPGEGTIEADLMFVGEAPGHDEDLQGRPFVGRAGQLLTKIIGAMTFQRDEVYITNVVKCRPPENRTPGREEVELCSPYLLKQLEIIRPRVIVTLGKVAADFFVRSPLGMTELRGKFFEFQQIPVMPTFHPSYLIRNEGNKEIKRLVWEDMQQVMRLLGRK